MEPKGSLPRSQDPPIISLLVQINPVDKTAFCSCKNYFNIIFPVLASLPPKKFCMFPLSAVCSTYTTNLILLDLIILKIFVEEDDDNNNNNNNNNNNIY